MNIVLDINKKSYCRVSKEFLKRIISKTIKLSSCDFQGLKTANVSIALVSENESRKINKKCRQISKSTDILSFSNYKNTKTIKGDSNKNIFLGELIICCEYIKKSVKINRNSFKKEMTYAVSHGTLHLLGFHHGEGMFNIQDKVTNSLT
ncbi:endoribonuclease YbeY [bacterium BMS3Abin15]|nr:endoribonuclease YbeY [bacterium BMS3Abin15]HDH07527.1 rRNA maturation RNase YbeY [Candidatus Moranbacteria bacterium]